VKGTGRAKQKLAIDPVTPCDEQREQMEAPGDVSAASCPQHCRCTRAILNSPAGRFRDRPGPAVPRSSGRFLHEGDGSSDVSNGQCWLVLVNRVG